MKELHKVAPNLVNMEENLNCDLKYDSILVDFRLCIANRPYNSNMSKSQRGCFLFFFFFNIKCHIKQNHNRLNDELLHHFFVYCKIDNFRHFLSSFFPKFFFVNIHFSWSREHIQPNTHTHKGELQTAGREKQFQQHNPSNLEDEPSKKKKKDPLQSNITSNIFMELI